MHATSLHPTLDEFWAWWRGQLYEVKSEQRTLFRLHTHQQSPSHFIFCVPMIAQGKTVGLFYLNTSDPQKLSEIKQELASKVSESVSLALFNLQLRESLKSQSIKDALTGLYNRRYMEESLKREVNLAQRKRHSVSLIMIDIDYFKQINDSFGHKAGDWVLQEVSNFLMANVRSGDIVCRYGGEEFLIILPEVSLADSQQKAEQLRQEIKKIEFKRDHQMFDSITISLGVACLSEHGKNSEDLIKAADLALYKAKNQGRDRVVVFSPDDQ